MKNFLLLSLLILTACGGPTAKFPEPREPAVRASGGTTSDNPMVSVKVKFAALQSRAEVKFCIRETKLIEANSWEAAFLGQLDEMLRTSLGSSIPMASVTPGVFRETALVLDPACPTGANVEIKNDFGTFTANVTGSLRFFGSVEIDANHRTLEAHLDNYLARFESIRSSSEIAEALATTTGTIEIAK